MLDNYNTSFNNDELYIRSCLNVHSVDQKIPFLAIYSKNNYSLEEKGQSVRREYMYFLKSQSNSIIYKSPICSPVEDKLSKL